MSNRLLTKLNTTKYGEMENTPKLLNSATHYYNSRLCSS